MKLRYIATTLFSACLIAGCSGKQENLDAAKEMAKSEVVQDAAKDMLNTAMTSSKETMTSGIFTDGFDTSVRVQDDFYDHVNGT